MNGVAKEGELLLKSGARPGQALILTKPLGTGVLMAASMRNKAKGRWVAGEASYFLSFCISFLTCCILLGGRFLSFCVLLFLFVYWWL